MTRRESIKTDIFCRRLSANGTDKEITRKVLRLVQIVLGNCHNWNFAVSTSTQKKKQQQQQQLHVWPLIYKFLCAQNEIPVSELRKLSQLWLSWLEWYSPGVADASIAHFQAIKFSRFTERIVCKCVWWNKATRKEDPAQIAIHW